MPKPIAKLFLLIVDLVSLPLLVVGYLLFLIGLRVRFRAARPSITACSLLYGRWIYDRTGRRPDPAGQQFLAALPGGVSWLARLIAGNVLRVMRVTGATLFGWTAYPVYSSTSMVSYLGQRTRFLDDALGRSLETVEQVVILGAGWDTRAYNLVRETKVRVYEVDLAHTQAVKREVLEKAQIELSGVVFCSADLIQESWLEALKRAGFDPNLPTFVLWEGVSYYMTQTAVEATLRTVATGLAAGSMIAFDYFSRDYVEGGELSLLPWPFAAFFHWIGEPHIFGLPTEPPAGARLAGFLAENGLDLAEFEPIGIDTRHSADTTHPAQSLDGGLALAVN